MLIEGGKTFPKSSVFLGVNTRMIPWQTVKRKHSLSLSNGSGAKTPTVSLPSFSHRESESERIHSNRALKHSTKERTASGHIDILNPTKVIVGYLRNHHNCCP